MKRVLIAFLFLLAPLTAQAASPEDSYFAARDEYIKQFSAIETWDDAVSDRYNAALRDLGQQLRQILGPLSPEGFSEDGKANIDALSSSDEGFGLLDGLSYASADGKSQLVVTTDSLLQHWLKEHENWWQGLANVPQEIDAALQSEVFYTQAISTDAAFTDYAAIPVTKPATAKFAYAILVGRSQDVMPMVPDEVLVSLVTEGRVFIVSAPAGKAVKSIAACDRVWKDFQKKADKAYTAYTNSNPQDEKLFDAYTKIQEDGFGAFSRCYAERAPKEKFFPALVKQAQAVVDRLPTE